MARAYWLMKSEPFKYPWEQLVRDGSTYWDGVRNYEARNNLAAMKKATSRSSTTRTRARRSSASPRS
jgi:predicted RNA-binding protein with PUA-like domain